MSLKLLFTFVSFLVITIHFRSRNHNQDVNELNQINLYENGGENIDFEQKHRNLKKNRRHKSNGFESSFYQASSQSVEGINEILRKLKLKFPIEKEMPLSYGAKIILSNIDCHTFMLHDLDHSFVLDEKKTEVTTDILVNGLTYGCSAKYQYKHGPFIRRPKGTVYITTKTSLDAQAKVFSSNFDTDLPLTASISSCKAESLIDINLGQSFVGRLFGLFKSSIEETFRESVREILCSELEESGNEAMESIISEIRKWFEPFFQEDKSFDKVDKLLPQKDLDSKNSVELIDFTSPKFDLLFSDLCEFIDNYSSFFHHLSKSWKEISSHYIKDLFEIDMTSRKLEKSEHSRELVISTIMTTYLIPIAQGFVSVIVEIMKDLFGSPEEFLQRIFFEVLNLVIDDGTNDDGSDNYGTNDDGSNDYGSNYDGSNGDNEFIYENLHFDWDNFGNDDDSNINNRRVKEILSYRIFDGKNWLVDFFDFDFIPNKIQETFDGFKIIWNGACISGTPIDINSLLPIAKQTIDMNCSISDLNLALKFQIIWDTIKMKREDFSMEIPNSSFDLTFQSGISNVNLESTFLAAFHVPSNETFSKEKAIEWSCKFFPILLTSFLGLEGNFKSPTIDGLFGSESSVDKLINGLVQSFFELSKGLYMDATSNFLGTTFINIIDSVIKGMLQRADEVFQKSCDDF